MSESSEEVHDQLEIFSQICTYGTTVGFSPLIYKNIQDYDGQTPFMKMLDSKKEMLDKAWWHDPSVIDNKGQTVAYKLLKLNFPIGPNWVHNPSYIIPRVGTISMEFVRKGKLPPVEWYHPPEKAFMGNTVLMNMIIKNLQINPSNKDVQYWIHSPMLRNQNGETPAILMAKRGMIIPKILYHDPAIRSNISQKTVSMEFASLGKIIPEEWRHNPSLGYPDQSTVAHILSSLGLLIPKEWWHSPNLRERYNKTVAMNYIDSKVLKIPQPWRGDPLVVDANGDTLAMHYALQQRRPPIWSRHDKDLQDSCGVSVFDLMLSRKGGLLEEYWYQKKIGLCALGKRCRILHPRPWEFAGLPTCGNCMICRQYKIHRQIKKDETQIPKKQKEITKMWKQNAKKIQKRNQILAEIRMIEEKIKSIF